MARGPLIACAFVGALCVLALVTFRLYDPDLWQHLRVGRAIWESGSIPHTQLWSWPTYGAPDVLPSWLFRAILWPFWNAFGLDGVFAFRWIAALATFALLWLAARRAGATGVAPIAAIVWCALIYRARSQARPETFAMVLAALELFVLEARRQGARWRGFDPAWALLPIACVWANSHISYYLAFVLSGGYLLDALWRSSHGGADERRAAAPRTLAIAIAGALAACFLNPFGWQALWQPFDYFLRGRHELIYRSISELSPVEWSVNVRNGLPAFLLLLVVLFVARTRRRGLDVAELAILGVTLPQALGSQRFVGYFAVCIAPFFARNLADWAANVRWPEALRAPWRRAALVVVVCVAGIVPGATDPVLGVSFGVDERAIPRRACDWMERHDVRGRGFNTFAEGGYLLWRFWPDSTRLPFMDIHQAGTPELRYLYVFALQDERAWKMLDERYRFDWALLPLGRFPVRGLLGFLDSDTSWRSVFVDDSAVLFLRRSGSEGALAESLGFRLLMTSDAKLGALGELAARDTAARATLRRELERSLSDSPVNSRAHSLLANIELSDGRYDDAERHLRAAIEQVPETRRAHERLGLIAMARGDATRALEEFRVELRVTKNRAAIEERIGSSLRSLGRTREAREAWERALRADPSHAALRDSIAGLGR